MPLDYGLQGSSIWDDADYGEFNLCRVCGDLIELDSEVCPHCKVKMARARGQAARLVEMKRDKRRRKLLGPPATWWWWSAYVE